MSEDRVRVIEIDGVKIEVDLRTAKKVETYRVGDNVHAMVKEYSSWEIYPGVITGFIDFDGMPTIQLAYLKRGELHKAHINAESKDPVRIAPLDEMDVLLNREDVLSSFDRKIKEKERELSDLETQRAYFNKCFGKYFAHFLGDGDESEVQRNER